MKISLDSILASDRLPSLPEVAARIVEIARNPEPDFDRMIEAQRLLSEIAVTSQLRLVNAHASGVLNASVWLLRNRSNRCNTWLGVII